jgi:ADP-L-glycero-D-manno-heptose 6-epimerase
MTQPPTYLVTGAAGFIGARFIESCQRRKILTLSVDREKHFLARKEHQIIDFGKILDFETLFDWLKKNRPPLNAIVHLGAITDTRETNGELLHRYNTGYSQSLWNYAVAEQIPFIYASSAATYGDGTCGYRDDEKLIPQLKPLNPYGESKQKFDLWILAQEASSSCPPFWSGFKFFNVYGFGESHKGFMSSVVLHAFQEIQEKGQFCLFRSHREGVPDGFQKRDFVFVDDVVEVLHFAIEKPIERGIFNLGTGQARTFLDLAHSVFTVLNRPEKIQFIDMPLDIRDKYQYFTEAKMEKLQSKGYPCSWTPLEVGVEKYFKRILSSNA